MGKLAVDCIFCKIGDKTIPAYIVYENGDVMAFLDANPRSPGHTVVISKYHAPTILELPSQEVEKLFGAVKNVTARLSLALQPAGFTIGVNHGTISGQTVQHLHVHVVPRFHGDGGGSVNSVVYNPPQESLDEIAKRISSIESW